MDNDLTIVFIGYDGYSDIWNDCINLFKRFWADCPYEILFINNEKKVFWDGVKVLHAGNDAEWSKKVQVAIKHCRTKYICLLLEDFFVGRPIDTNTIKRMMRFIENEKINYYKLANMNRAIKNHDPIYKDYKFLHIIPKSDEYGISLQAAIWNIDYLKELVGNENYNAWIFEFNRVKESEEKNNEPIEKCLFDERNILNLQHGVIQSKYLPNTIRYFKKIGISLNIEREIMSYSQYYKLRMISKGKYIIPKRLRKPVKRGLEKCGMKFVSTIRNN